MAELHIPMPLQVPESPQGGKYPDPITDPNWSSNTLGEKNKQIYRLKDVSVGWFDHSI